MSLLDLIILIAVGAVALIIVLVVFFKKQTQKRIGAWQAMATRLGWQSAPENAKAFLARYPNFKIFRQGHSQRIRARIVGAHPNHSDIEMALVDFQYVTGGGKHSQVHTMIVGALARDHFAFPHCFLRRKSFFDSIGKLFGGKDIRFDTDPLFSKAFLLKGDKDEPAARALFNPTARQFFNHVKDKIAYLETEGRDICFVLKNSRKIASVHEYIEFASRLIDLWPA